MAHHARSKGDKTGMAGIALRRRRNMVGRPAKRSCPVMASSTSTGNGRRRSGMIKRRSRPAYCRVMAGIALCCRRNMGRWFSLRILYKIRAIMATRTLPRQTGMVHH